MGQTTSIRRADIPAEGLRLETSWDAALLAQLLEDNGQLSVCPPLRLGLELRLTGAQVVLEGTCQAQITIACIRCLEQFPRELRTTFYYMFQPHEALDRAAEIQLSRSDLEIVCYDGESIDLVPLVIEQIHLGIPEYPLCGPGCKGLCSQCGTDLNKGACTCSSDGPQKLSPFAALEALKKKS